MKLLDGDYVLAENAAWLEVQGFAIRVRATPKGLSVEVYESGQEASGELDSLFVGVDHDAD